METEAHKYNQKVLRYEWEGDPPIQINKIWWDWMPDPSNDELEGLEASLLKYGCKDPIETNADGDIIDGMHRFDICEQHGIPVIYRILDHIATDIDSRRYMISKQRYRRNSDTDQKRYLLAEDLRLEVEQNADLHRPPDTPEPEQAQEVTESDNLGAKFAPKDAEVLNQDEPPPIDTISATREERDAVAKRAGVSRRTVDYAVADANRIAEFPRQVKHHANGCGEKLSSKDIEKLYYCTRIGEVEAALRMGRAETIREAWEQVYGKPLSATRVPKQDGETKEPDPRDELLTKTKGIQKTIDVNVRAVYELQNLFPKDRKLSKAVLAGFDVTRIALEKWRQAHLRHK
jgi:hypothetical protein